MATGPPTEGPKPPDVTTPNGFARGRRGKQQSPAAHRHSTLRPQADAAPWRTVVELSQHHVRAGETARARAVLPADFLDRPFQRRLDWCRVFVEIRTVKAKACLGP